jgi:hypothetical protein
VLTTFRSYGDVSSYRQAQIMQGFASSLPSVSLIGRADQRPQPKTNFVSDDNPGDEAEHNQ